MVLRAVVIVVVAGCAPVGGLRPVPGVGAENGAEVGVGVVGQSPRPWVDEEWRGGVEMWGSGRLGGRIEMSTIVAIDAHGVAGGVALRWIAVERDRVALGVELQVGWLWAAVAVPVSLRMFGESRLYAAPRLGTFGARLTPALPVGVSLGLPSDTALRLEGQVSFPAFDPVERRFHLGAGVAQGLR